MENRRKRSRFIEQNEVCIRTALNKYQGTGITAYTYDLSTGGARILSSKYYPVGTDLRIRINLAKSNQAVTLDAGVVWIRARDAEDLFEIGVEFRRLTSHAVLTLLKHLYGQNAVIPSTIS